MSAKSDVHNEEMAARDDISKVIREYIIPDSTNALAAVLETWGAKDVLACLGKLLSKTESAGNGHYVGKILTELSQIEW